MTAKTQTDDPASTIDELSEKQQAAVRWLAANRDTADDLSRPEQVAAIEEEYGAAMSPTYLPAIERDYGDLIDAIGDNGAAVESGNGNGNGVNALDDAVSTVRGVDGTQDVEEEGEEETGPHYDPVKLTMHARRADVDKGVPYFARVTGTKPFGVFVELNASGDADGLVHRSNLPLCRPQDFSIGDELIVALIERRDGGKLSFSIVETIDTRETITYPRLEIPDTPGDVPDDSAVAADSAAIIEELSEKAGGGSTKYDVDGDDVDGGSIENEDGEVVYDEDIARDAISEVASEDDDEGDEFDDIPEDPDATIDLDDLDGGDPSIDDLIDAYGDGEVEVEYDEETRTTHIVDAEESGLSARWASVLDRLDDYLAADGEVQQIEENIDYEHGQVDFHVRLSLDGEKID